MPRLALAALPLALLIAGCGIAGTPTVDAPVTVYVSLPLTGPQGGSGRDAADGARLALEEAEGRAGSIQVRAVYLDDAKGRIWDPVAVGANARQAVQDSSAAAYIGELDSEPTAPRCRSRTTPASSRSRREPGEWISPNRPPATRTRRTATGRPAPPASRGRFRPTMWSP